VARAREAGFGDEAAEALLDAAARAGASAEVKLDRLL
jgi:hypothetical protein